MCGARELKRNLALSLKIAVNVLFSGCGERENDRHRELDRERDDDLDRRGGEIVPMT